MIEEGVHMKKLPIGIQSFREIIEGNYIYVDKTQAIHEMIDSGKFFFLSRPRRFGKSLLLNTLREIFLGNQDLFQGLFIYDKISWEKHPVLLIDFSVISHTSPEVLREAILEVIDEYAIQYGVELTKKFLSSRFEELIKKISEVTSAKVVVLIDEYDKPIIDHIEDLKKAENCREVLREFYGVLKQADIYLKFVFLTGVSKFAKVSIFSGLNNLLDITLDFRFTTITGITQAELENEFGDYLSQLMKREGQEPNNLFDRIKHWYNGYSWDGVNKVYNPFSILNLLSSIRFSNYWFATGTPTVLIKLIKTTGTGIADIENKQITEMVLDSYDLENINLFALLFQTGYLTITRLKQEDGITQYTLNYPNFEVKTSLLTFIMEGISQNRLDEIQPKMLRLKDALKQGDLETFIKIIKTIFAKIPAHLYIEKESYYHSLFYLVLALTGVELDLEVLTDRGRIDGVLELKDKVYVIEFKYGEPGTKMEKLLEQAIRQIKARRYHEKYLDSGRQIYLLGVGFCGKEIGYRCNVQPNIRRVKGKEV
jgi:hypothetical protein